MQSFLWVFSILSFTIVHSRLFSWRFNNHWTGTARGNWLSRSHWRGRTIMMSRQLFTTDWKLTDEWNVGYWLTVYILKSGCITHQHTRTQWQICTNCYVVGFFFCTVSRKFACRCRFNTETLEKRKHLIRQHWVLCACQLSQPWLPLPGQQSGLI